MGPKPLDAATHLERIWDAPGQRAVRQSGRAQQNATCTDTLTWPAKTNGNFYAEMTKSSALLRVSLGLRRRRAPSAGMGADGGSLCLVAGLGLA